LKLSLILGSEKHRKEALRAKADIYVINRENVAWLIAHLGGAFPFDMLVIDESSSFKSPKSQRFKALRQIRPRISRVLILTGTPSPNGLLDLWSQMYLLDQGERLGKTLTGFRDYYFKPNQRNGHVVYNYKLRQSKDELLGPDQFEKEIYDKIGDICISMKAKDYLDLPDCIIRDIPVSLGHLAYSKYLKFEEEQILALDDIDEISAVNAAALTNKLLQFANGAVYDADKNFHEVHKEKIERLDEIIEAANGQPVLVFYSYKHDLARIHKALKHYKLSELKTPKDIERWNKGEIPVLLAHPGSAGHGLNLQAGGNIIVWFGHTWSLELYQQANARLHRQGQTKPVIIHRLVSIGTMDEEVLKVLDRKAKGQDALMQAVKARVNFHFKHKKIRA